MRKPGKKVPAPVWHIYVLRCSDDSLYCGIALDVPRRISQHQNGKGAKYTRSRLPVSVLWIGVVGTSVGEALRAEREFKALGRARKLAWLKARTDSVCARRSRKWSPLPP